jgi:hypothetical protein
METHNFHLYIGSKAMIAEMHGENMDKILMSHRCENFVGITNQLFAEKPVCLICINPGEIDNNETEFYLDESKLILRPLNSITESEAREYRKLYEPNPNFCTTDPWWEKELLSLKNPSHRLMWLIKMGFDIGLIPKEKFILTIEPK